MTLNELYHYGIKGQQWGVRRYDYEAKGLKGVGSTYAKDYRDKNIAIRERYIQEKAILTSKGKSATQADKARYLKARENYKTSLKANQDQYKADKDIIKKRKNAEKLNKALDEAERRHARESNTKSTLQKYKTKFASAENSKKIESLFGKNGLSNINSVIDEGIKNNDRQMHELGSVINHYSNKKLNDITDKDLDYADKFLKTHYKKRIKASDYGAK